jgi:hypothetical protein
MEAAAAAEHLQRFLASVAVEGQSIPALGMEAVEVLPRATEHARVRARAKAKARYRKGER